MLHVQLISAVSFAWSVLGTYGIRYKFDSVEIEENGIIDDHESVSNLSNKSMLILGDGSSHFGDRFAIKVMENGSGGHQRQTVKKHNMSQFVYTSVLQKHTETSQLASSHAFSSNGTLAVVGLSRIESHGIFSTEPKSTLYTGVFFGLVLAACCYGMFNAHEEEESTAVSTDQRRSRKREKIGALFGRKSKKPEGVGEGAREEGKANQTGGSAEVGDGEASADSQHRNSMTGAGMFDDDSGVHEEEAADDKTTKKKGSWFRPFKKKEDQGSDPPDEQ